MNNIDFREIDITFRYETYLSSNKDEKIFKDYNIIKNGLFNHYNTKGDDIRNINFYNYYSNIQCDRCELQARNNISKNGVGDISDTQLQENLKKNNGTIKLPFTSNYITLENINYVVSNETEKKKLTKDDILKEPDKYQELLRSRTFETITIRFSAGLNIFENYKSDYNDFFEQNFSNKEDFLIFLNKYNYQDFFEKYKIKQSLFDNKIVKNNRYPIDNILIDDLNVNCKPKIDEIVSTNSIFSKFKDNNYENFFKIKKDSSYTHLTSYFDKLKENFEDNLKKDSEDARGDYSSKIVKLNTPKEFKEILYKYGEYFVSDNDYKTNNSAEKFYNFIRSDKTLINKIISYYNIYIILSEIYIVRDSIIYSSKEFEKELNSNKYRKIKKIIPCTQLSHISFNNSNKLKCYFNIEFENINNYSVVRFNTNLINIEKKIIDNNKTRKKYINYGIKLFDTKSNKKEISIQTDINLDSLKYDFNSLLNKNIELFKTKNPKNIKEIFFDNDLFNYVTSKYYKKTNDINSFLSDLVYKIFFYKNPENILYNNKFYVVDNVKIINPKEFKENKDIIKKFKEKLNKKENEAPAEGQQASAEQLSQQKVILINSLKNEFPQLKDEIANYINKENKLREDNDFFNNNYLEFKTPDKRLSIDKIDNRYEVFLDVICFIKNSLDEKISLKKRMTCNFDCYNSANNLDSLFKILMKQYFNDNSFKRMLNPSNKGDINLINNSSIKENIKEDLKQDIKEHLKQDIKEDLKQDIKEDNDLIDGGKKIKKKYNYYFKKNKKNNNKYVKKTLKHKNKKNNTLKVRKLIKYYLKNY